METIGWLSILPPVVAIALAIKTREVYISLAIFVWLGWTIMDSWNPVVGLVNGVNTFLAAITEPGNARTLVFSALIGGIITLTQASGGMEGFINWVERKRLGQNRRTVRLFAIGTSMCLFLESNFGLLVAGSVSRPLFDRAKISREKLSYILDATCAPKQLLIPINAWGAYIVALLLAQDVAEPPRVLLSALPLNFYAILSIILVVFVALTDWNIGPMRVAERRIQEEGKLLRDGAEPMMSSDVSMLAAKEGVPRRAVNMLLPIIAMVATVPLVLWITGGGEAQATNLDRLLAGSGSDAVLWGVIVGILLAAAMYRAQGIMKFKRGDRLHDQGNSGTDARGDRARPGVFDRGNATGPGHGRVARSGCGSGREPGLRAGHHFRACMSHGLLDGNVVGHLRDHDSDRRPHGGAAGSTPRAHAGSGSGRRDFRRSLFTDLRQHDRGVHGFCYGPYRPRSYTASLRAPGRFRRPRAVPGCGFHTVAKRCSLTGRALRYPLSSYNRLLSALQKDQPSTAST